jgi:hypothetical protein
VATRELQILPSTHGDQSGVIGSAAESVNLNEAPLSGIY